VLKFLFLQYDTNPGPTFASRFMKLVGNLFIGSLAAHDFGHLRRDAQASYFYIKEDRQLPPPGAALEQWQIEGILLAQFRELQAPQVARAAFYGLLVINFAFVALAMVVRPLVA
jgi:hypothetical protein